MWVDDDAPPVGQDEKAALSRVDTTSDDVEYFGDDRAWSDTAGHPLPHQQFGSSSPSRPTQVAPEDLSAHHLGRALSVRWDDENRYSIGTIIAVAADSETISVKLAGVEKPVSVRRDASGEGPDNPRLYVWM